MEFKNTPHIVYVKTNSDGYITAVNSSAFLTDTTDWTEIDSGYEDKYHHAQGNYFPEPVFTDGGAYRYKLLDGEAVQCTAEELEQQLEKYCTSTGASLEERVTMLESISSETKKTLAAISSRLT